MNAGILVAIVVVAVAFEAFCLANIYRAEAVRYLPKWGWAGICVITIPLGGIAYLAVGRTRQL